MGNRISIPVINDKPTKKEMEKMFYDLMSREDDMNISHDNSPEPKNSKLLRTKRRMAV